MFLSKLYFCFFLIMILLIFFNWGLVLVVVFVFKLGVINVVEILSVDNDCSNLFII